MGYVVKTLSKHPAAKCEVRIYDNGTIEMVSYTTRIVEAKPVSKIDGVILYHISAIKEGKYSDQNEESRIYSPTTARQISAFLAEYFQDINYQEFKRVALGNDGAVLPALIKKGVYHG